MHPNPFQPHCRPLGGDRRGGVSFLSAPRLLWCALLPAALILAAFAISGADPLTAAAAGPQRERILLHSGWRFQKGNPPGFDTGYLLYDARPQPRDLPERPAEYTEDPEILKASGRLFLKPFILPTGNAFLKDPQARHLRPAGNPGGDLPYVQPDFDDSAWKPVRVPHDWAIEGPFTSKGGGGMGRLPSAGVAWYRRKLDIPARDAGKSIFLEVDGAMSYAAVWLNGQLVGGWPYGYASWQLDLTPYVKPGGTNQLAIRLDNPPDSARWYPGGGLYRNVWLLKTAPVHVAQWGTFVTTPQVSRESATVHLEVTVQNLSRSEAKVSVATAIHSFDAAGRLSAKPVALIPPALASVAPGSATVVKGSAVVRNPRLWGPPPQQEPNLYLAVTTLSQLGRIIDRYETRFGIRSVDLKPDGVYVNGERIQIKGVNLHHDLGALGAAFHLRAAERQLQILREMGCNAVRTAHNPPAPELLDLTDRMGFLVMDEIFDVWIRRKTPIDFHLIFPDWHEQDLRAFIRRDRNHPSVFLWSVGNEVGEQYTGEEGAAVGRRLLQIAREEDPTRRVTSSMNFAKADSPFAAVWDVISLNYQGEGIRDTPAFEGFQGIRTPPQYPSFRQRFPDKTIMSSESAAALSSRGVYLFPVSKEISGPVRDGSGGDSRIRHVSAYELYAADFGSSADKVFGSIERHPYVAGEFVWSGWDYLGEPTPYNASRSSYFGILDLAGFRKDRFYLYQSHWRPDLPMAHILPHWTWPERVGQVTPVHVFTSGDAAELFLNGKSLGRKQKQQYEYRLRWDEVVYEPGELKVIAYKNGKPWSSDSVRTAGPPARLALSADRSILQADGFDLSFVTVRVLDAAGVDVPRADNLIRFRIDGPGDIVGTDNGDPTSFESFLAPERKAFNGLALAIVRARAGRPGAIRLTAESAGLRSAGITLRSTATR